MEHISKRLHFTVRHPGYSQHIGYGYFLNDWLRGLNEKKPNNSWELLSGLSGLLYNLDPDVELAPKPKERKKDAERFYNCIPEETRKRHGIKDASFFDNTTEEGLKNLKNYFGSAGLMSFGFFFHEYIQYCEDVFHKQIKGESAKFHGLALITPVVDSHGGGARGYYTVFQEIYGGEITDDLTNLEKQVTYPIPGEGRDLQLMRLGTMQQLMPYIRGMYDGDDDDIQRLVISRYNGRNYKLALLHPECDIDFVNDLDKCLTPLLAVIDRKDDVIPGSAPPEDKIDAIAEFYWLLAQSTPIYRGGSAYANVMLEHMAHRLRDQGYDYEIPYTKENVDLWAYGALMPLESKDGITGFKESFKKGMFFDRLATDTDIELYMHNALQKEGVEVKKGVAEISH